MQRLGRIGRSTHRQSHEMTMVQPHEARLRILHIGIVLFIALVILRLFTMQVLQNEFYTSLASGTHDIYRELLPSRVSIFLRDRTNPDDLYPLAMNRNVYKLFIDNRENPDPDKTATELAPLLGWDDEKKLSVFFEIKGSASDDPFIPIAGAHRVSEDTKEQIDAKQLPGVQFVKSPYRYFPENTFAAHVLGFYGLNSEGQPSGSYGIEGYFQNELAGEQGFIEGKRDAFGSWIPTAARQFEAAEDGADIIVTLDRSIQFTACSVLNETAELIEAESAASIILNPKTGAIMAMCSYPEFDPNVYNEVEGIEVYNNHAIFTAYEPGSVFKTLTMAAALDEGVITPELEYDDPGSRHIDGFDIGNALDKHYGKNVSMTTVLQKSINTGMIFIVEKLGNEKFAQYVKDFGFGKKTGVEISTESAGNITALDKSGLIFAATGSFGQGITVTPLQVAAAYGALANNGVLMRPYIIDEIRYPDGTVDAREPQKIRQVISTRAAHLITGMLTSVISEEYAGVAGLSGYHLGGKTGTAQIAGAGGYTDETNHTFVGYGPTEDPQFVILSKFEKPNMRWASQTSAPYFGRMARFLVQYLEIAPTR